MRGLSRAAIVLAAMAFAVPSLQAQKPSINISAGASLPTGDAADGVEMGYNAAVGLGLKPALLPLGLRVEGMFNTFQFKEAISDGSWRVMGLTANATYTVIPALYLIGGVGLYNSKASEDGAEASNDFGFNFGAGVNIPLTGFGTYIEARFHHVPGENDSNFQFIPISFGIKF
jgi:hypothetical protein